MGKPFEFYREPDGSLSMESAVYQALAAASMCVWGRDYERFREIKAALMAELDRFGVGPDSKTYTAQREADPPTPAAPSATRRSISVEEIEEAERDIGRREAARRLLAYDDTLSVWNGAKRWMAMVHDGDTDVVADWDEAYDEAHKSRVRP